MPKILLDDAAYREVLAQRGQFDAPIRWHGLIDRISAPEPASGSSSRGGLLLSWTLSRATFRAAVAGSPLVYQCWGLGGLKALTRFGTAFVLRRARVVAVNDAITENEVRALADTPVVRHPYFVDTDYYSPDPHGATGSFLFCPSSNDRDPAILLALAKAGYEVVWLNNNDLLVDKYKAAHANLKIVSRLSFVELRSLYRNSRAVLLPLARDVHAAGQTTALEAIACGKAVLMTQGRTSSIFSGEGLITEISSNDSAEWLGAVAKLLAASDQLDAALPARVDRIRARHGFDASAQAMREIFEQAWLG